MDKKKLKSAASFKDQAKQSTSGDNDNLFLPEVPSFLPSLDSLKNDPQAVSFERDVLYENERLHTARLGKSTGPQEGDDDVVTSCDSLARAWISMKNVPCVTYESLLASNRPGHVDPNSAVGKTKSNALDFEALFGFGDVLTRETEQLCAAEVFCESLARDIVNRSADLYAARCLDAVKEGYTALSVWEDLREEVARAFLPFDLCDNCGGGGGGGGDGAAAQQRKPGHGLHALQVLDIPLSDVLVDFSDHLRASKRKDHLSTGAPSAGAPPPGVQLDEYSRHIMRLEDAKAFESETKPAETTKSRKPLHSLSPQKEQASMTVLPAAGGSGSGAADTGAAGEHQLPAAYKSSPLSPPQNTFKAKTKKKLTSTKTSGKPAGNSVGPEGGSATSTDNDDLTTALKQLPPGYFASSYPAKRGSTAGQANSPNASAKFQSTRRASQARDGSTGVTAAALKKGGTVVDIEGNRALTNKSTKVKSKAPKRPSIDRGADHGVTYKIVNKEAKPPAPEVTPEAPTTNPAPASGALKKGSGTLRGSSSTYTDKSRQEKLRELNRQKEYEEAFVEPSANASVDVGVEVTPAPGVSISQSAGATRKAHGASTAKSGKSVKDGGEFVPSTKRDSLSHTALKENERGARDARLSSSKASVASKENTTQSDLTRGHLPAVRPKK